MTVYTITELQELLKLNPKQAKALMRTEGFPSIKIGREYRVEEDMLRQWFADNKEFCKESLEYYNDTELYRKEVHKQFPALYPDDIENISNMSEEKSYLCCQIQATILQRMRSSTPIDTSCWCTCPKKESQN